MKNIQKQISMITEKKFMLISIRDNKLKVKVDQYNPENNDAFHGKQRRLSKYLYE